MWSYNVAAPSPVCGSWLESETVHKSGLSTSTRPIAIAIIVTSPQVRLPHQLPKTAAEFHCVHRVHLPTASLNHRFINLVTFNGLLRVVGGHGRNPKDFSNRLACFFIPFESVESWCPRSIPISKAC